MRLSEGTPFKTSVNIMDLELSLYLVFPLSSLSLSITLPPHISLARATAASGASK